MTTLPSALPRLLIAAVLAIALLASALLSAEIASAASVRQAERAVVKKVRNARHVARVDAHCQDNHGWFGCYWTVDRRDGFLVGNARVVMRRHKSAKIKLFGLQCVGGSCKKK